MTIKQRLLKILGAGLMLTCCTAANSPLQAQQEEDFEARVNIAADWHPLKNVVLEGRYRLGMFDNATRFKRSLGSLSAAYDLNKWLRVGGEYRYYTSYEKDFHRFNLYLRGDYSWRKWDFRYRLQYQQQQDYYFEPEYLGVHTPSRVFRNKFLAAYQYSRKMSVYGYAETFSSYKRDVLKLYRMRYGMGCNYLYKRRHTVGGELFVNDEFNKTNPNDRLTAELNYTYHFTKKKKKKKKNSKPGEP